MVCLKGTKEASAQVLSKQYVKPVLVETIVNYDELVHHSSCRLGREVGAVCSRPSYDLSINF